MTLSFTTRFLHWIVGLLMIGLIAVGIYMEQNNVYALYPLHKSIGALALIVIVWRVVWRIKEGWPSRLPNHKAWEHYLAKAIKYLLIVGTVAMPVSGIIMSIGGGHGLSIFGFEIVAGNIDLDTGRSMPLNKDLYRMGGMIHGLGGKILIGAIALHFLGAMKHHVIDKDSTLRRMVK